MALRNQTGNSGSQIDAYDQLHAVTSSSQPQKQSATALVVSQLQDDSSLARS